jgi:hypothetical protein
MSEQQLRDQALQNLNRRRTLAIADVGITMAIVVLIGIWALTGAGYFWPGWAILVAVVANTIVGLTYTASNRRFSETQVRFEVARLQGVPPPGIQR